MKNFSLKTKTGRILFEGRFASFKRCLETAVAEGVNLESADIRHINLGGATMDGARLRRASFHDCNLAGANLSEADLRGADFTNADLYNACFVGADLRGARFEGASFGATDIAGADISHCVFSTLSCIWLDFHLARAMKDCLFLNPDGKTGKMSQPPVVIKGYSDQMVIFMDHCVKVGPTFLEDLRNPSPISKTGGSA